MAARLEKFRCILHGSADLHEPIAAQLSGRSRIEWNVDEGDGGDCGGWRFEEYGSSSMIHDP